MGTPLFVVDGVTRDQDYFSRMDASEIDNISVLKDGSAAIYGLRAANGVILVTTKSGTAQDGKVDIIYSSNYSISQFLKVPHGISALDYMTLVNEWTFQDFSKNYLVRQAPYFTQAQMQPYIDGKPSYDWMDAIFKKSTLQYQQNLSVDGGNDKLRYFMNLSYFKHEGNYISGDYYADRWNFRINVDGQITKRLKAKVLIGAILDEANHPYESSRNFFYKQAWLMRPDVPIYANDNPLYLNGETPGLYDGHNMLAQTYSDIVGYRK
jgi:TonB-dependent SusC/RagA subfamily outer membrane receptor